MARPGQRHPWTGTSVAGRDDTTFSIFDLTAVSSKFGVVQIRSDVSNPSEAHEVRGRAKRNRKPRNASSAQGQERRKGARMLVARWPTRRGRELQQNTQQSSSNNQKRVGAAASTYALHVCKKRCVERTAALVKKRGRRQGRKPGVCDSCNATFSIANGSHAAASNGVAGPEPCVREWSVN